MVAASETLSMLPDGEVRGALLVVGDMDPPKGGTEMLMLPGLVEKASPWPGELAEV